MTTQTTERKPLTVEEALQLLPEEQRKLFGQPLPPDFDIDDVLSDEEVEAVRREVARKYESR
jgi:hypothetical protein